MSSEYDPALEALERKLNESEQAARGYRVAINALLELKGLKPRFPPDGSGGGTGGSGGGGGGVGAGPLTIKSDAFFGKRLSTAMREYLQMRRGRGDGQPATPREIFDALKAGGYKFEAKNDEIALVSIRAMLRKNTPTFVKVGEGRYGLVAWYPEMRKPKGATPGREAATADDDDDLDLGDDETLEDEDAA